MKERIEKLIDALVKKRDGLRDMYLKSLEEYSVSDNTWNMRGEAAVSTVGLIHDIDKHITNLHLELKELSHV